MDRLKLERVEPERPKKGLEFAVHGSGTARTRVLAEREFGKKTRPEAVARSGVPQPFTRARNLRGRSLTSLPPSVQ